MAVTRSRSLADLQALSEVQRKLGKFEEIRKMLLKEIAAWKTENGCLSEYVSEFNLLTQEKLAHVEVLRQINCDMNQLESIIKQARSDQLKAAETAKRLFSELLPLKDEINFFRAAVNQEMLPDNVVNKEALSVLLQAEQQTGPSSGAWHQPTRDSTSMGAGDFSLPTLSAAAPSPGSGHSSIYRVGNQFDLLGHLSIPIASSNYQCLFSPVVDLSMSGVVPKQQQPPPMKTCNSCQQQIHRNAPICPLCKSKSRSRNPKKAKIRKMND